jgi:outer membrane protein OmpA-like peptidoglycan-associated protein
MRTKGIGAKLLAALFALIFAVIFPGGQAKADGMGILGFLTCTKTGPGMTYLVFSRIPVDCTYNGVGGPQNYTGRSGILLGVDLEYEQQAALIYAVIGGSSVSPGGLAGSYGGVKASATVGIGPALQGGLAGIGNGFELVPLGFGGQVGVGVTGGIGYLQITYVTPSAVAVPPPPPPPPVAAAPEPARTFIVYFDFDKSTLTAAGRNVVDAAAALAKQNVPMHIQVNGYTDTSGTKKYNLALSKRRADTVRAALAGDGVTGDRVTVMGYGEENLRVQTPDGVKEPQNRRAEILIGP